MSDADADRRATAGIVEDALVAVFDAELVHRLREDSPLAGLGMTDADAVCVVDAIASMAQRSGLVCELSDDDLTPLVTVADLIDAVAARLADSA